MLATVMAHFSNQILIVFKRFLKSGALQVLLVLFVIVAMNPVRLRFRISSPWKRCHGKGEMGRWQGDRVLLSLVVTPVGIPLLAPTLCCKDTLVEGSFCYTLTVILHLPNLKERQCYSTCLFVLWKSMFGMRRGVNTKNRYE